MPSSRLVLADTNVEELHDTIGGLRNLVRELEDSLRTLQSASSSDMHPMLRDQGQGQRDLSDAPRTPVQDDIPPRTTASIAVTGETESVMDVFGGFTVVVLQDRW
jgi:hypothetical protein